MQNIKKWKLELEFNRKAKGMIYWLYLLPKKSENKLLKKIYNIKRNSEIKQLGYLRTLVVQDLELRLDIIVFRSLWVSSRKEAIYEINQGNILVNGSKPTKWNIILKQGDIITGNIEYFYKKWTSNKNKSKYKYKGRKKQLKIWKIPDHLEISDELVKIVIMGKSKNGIFPNNINVTSWNYKIR